MGDLKEVKIELEERRLRRRANIEAVEEILAAITFKISGAAMLGVGVTDYFWPDAIRAILPYPVLIAGIGFSMLAGKKATKSGIDAVGQILKLR